MRRSVCGVMWPIGKRPSASSCSLPAHGSARECVHGCCPGAGASRSRRERRLALAARVFGPVLGQALAQRRHDRDVALAGIGLRRRSRDAQAASRDVEVRAIEPAELRDAQAAEDQRVDDNAARHVVAVPWSGPAIPQLAAADLAYQRVGNPELACERDRGPAGAPDEIHALPCQSAMLGLDQIGRV